MKSMKNFAPVYVALVIAIPNISSAANIAGEAEIVAPNSERDHRSKGANASQKSASDGGKTYDAQLGDRGAGGASVVALYGSGHSSQTSDLDGLSQTGLIHTVFSTNDDAPTIELAQARRWAAGQRLDQRYRSARIDHRRYKLRNPGPGQHWVRVNNQFLLIVASTGIVVSIANAG